METTIVFLGYIEIMEKKMETTIVYLGYIEIMITDWERSRGFTLQCPKAQNGSPNLLPPEGPK